MKKSKMAAVMAGAMLFASALGGCAARGAERIKVPTYEAMMSTDYTYDSEYSDYVNDGPGLINPFIVGVDRAKDLLLGVDASAGRIRLTGNGPARMHWYKGVRPDYWGQMLSEVKAPHRSIRGRKVWQKKSGERNEALDCEVYALHAARALKINLWSEKRWAALERELHQMSIFDIMPAEPVAKPASEVQLEAPAEEPAKVAPEEKPKPARPKKKRRNYGSYSPW